MDDYRVATSPSRHSRESGNPEGANAVATPASAVGNRENLGRVDIRLKRTIITLSPPILTVIPAKAGIQRVAGNVIVTRPLTVASANVNAP